jgi:hypothetical protein
VDILVMVTLSPPDLQPNKNKIILNHFLAKSLGKRREKTSCLVVNDSFLSIFLRAFTIVR